MIDDKQINFFILKKNVSIIKKILIHEDAYSISHTSKTKSILILKKSENAH